MTTPEPRTDLPNGWRGAIADLDSPTSDGRMAATPPGGVKTRAYPLTLTRNHVGDPTGYPTIGSVDHVWVDPDSGVLMGEGQFDLGGQEGQDAARQLATGMLNRVSIDPVEVEAEMRVLDPEGNLLATPEGGWTEETFDALGEGYQPVTTFTDWTLAGLAMVPIPAYTKAAINPIWDYTPSAALPTDAIVSAAAQPDYSDHSMVALRPARPNTFAVKNGSPASGLHVTLAYFGQGQLADHVQNAGHSAAQAAALALHGDAMATVAGYGHLGDSQNPATVLYLNGPGIDRAHRAAQEAVLIHGAQDDIPAQHQPFAAHMTLGYGVPLAAAKPFMGRSFALKGASFDHQGTTTQYAKPSAVVAAVGGQVFRRDFFQNPNLDGPTPMTVTEEGHVYGHVRLSGSCYQFGGGKGNGGTCLEPPPSACGYAKFMCHGAVMDDGSQMAVGALTFGDGHVSRGGLEASRKHYDNVATVAAKVVAGEDEFGVWISGEVVEEFRDRAYDLLLAPLSGHWEPDADNKNHLEMLAAHLVVTPGYSVPRIVASFDDDAQPSSLIITEAIVAAAEEEVVVPSPRAQVLADFRRAEALAKRIGVEPAPITAN